MRDRADAGEERVTEPRERVHAGTQRRLESRLRGELVAESEQLETWSGVVEEEETVAESIGEALGVPGNEARGIWRSAERLTQGSGGRCHATVTTALCD